VALGARGMIWCGVDFVVVAVDVLERVSRQRLGDQRRETVVRNDLYYSGDPIAVRSR
jgi:hypothetical protein